MKFAISTRNKRSPYRVLYVYNETNQLPPAVRREIELKAHDVIVLDGLGRHGLAPHFPGRRRLWAIHYVGNGRSLEAGLCGDVIPSWCAALHSAFSAILTAASQKLLHGLQGHAGGPGTARPVAWSRPVTRPRPHAPGPLWCSPQSCRTALLVWRRSKSEVMPRETHIFRAR